MLYAKPATEEFGFTATAVSDALNTTFPVGADLTSHGYVSYTEAAHAGDHTKNYTEVYPVDGAQTWAETNATNEQKAERLAVHKALKNDEINAARLAANRTTFTHGGKQIACDPLSRGDIDGVTAHVSMFGTMPPGWPGAWKAVDNTYVSLPDVDAWKAFLLSMVGQGMTNFGRSEARKATLAAATTVAQINAIVW